MQKRPSSMTRSQLADVHPHDSLRSMQSIAPNILLFPNADQIRKGKTTDICNPKDAEDQEIPQATP
jgi:hypothetical protein